MDNCRSWPHFAFRLCYSQAFQMISMVARRFLISGMVQGVGYRFFAMRAAARHQVLGTVRNLPDGRVEVLAEGDRDAMDEFKNDLAKKAKKQA